MVDSLHYCYWFRLHRSKAEEEKKEQNVTFHLCKDAIEKLPKSMGPYCVYTDNWYGSEALAKWCVQNQIKFTFGCRANRPTYLFEHGLHPEMDQYHGLVKFGCWIHNSGNFAAISWEDKKIVNYISSIEANNLATVEQRQHKEHEKTPKLVPAVVADYTENGMGHVDTFNHLLSIENPQHKNWCWRRTHFVSLIKITLVNIHVFYNTLTRQNLTHKQILSQLAKELRSRVEMHKNLLKKKKRSERNQRYKDKEKETKRRKVDSA